MPFASPFSIRMSISLNLSRPGALADFDSEKVREITTPCDAARSVSVPIWESIDNTCRPSSSDDLRHRENIFVRCYSWFFSSL